MPHSPVRRSTGALPCPNDRGAVSREPTPPTTAVSPLRPRTPAFVSPQTSNFGECGDTNRGVLRCRSRGGTGPLTWDGSARRGPRGTLGAHVRRRGGQDHGDRAVARSRRADAGRVPFFGGEPSAAGREIVTRYFETSEPSPSTRCIWERPRRSPCCKSAALERTLVRRTTVRYCRGVGVEERFEGIRRSAAMAPLSRESVTELVSIAASLIEERRRIRRLLRQMPESFAEVRKALNELARTVR